MNLPNLKDLSKIIDLCRKKGVESIEINGVKITLSAEAPRTRRTKHQNTNEAPVTENQFSEDETLFWSSAGLPIVEEQADA